MLVRCPKCQSVSRPVSSVGQSRSIDYFCPHCQKIVRIDLARDEAKPSSSTDPTEETKPSKILVADDNVRVRTFAVSLLRDNSYDVLEAEDGPQALNLIKEKHPDLILISLMLPLMTGYDVIEEIQKNGRTKGTPVILMSDAVSQKEVLGTLGSSGIVGFINKRQIRDSLLSRVREFLPD